MVGVSDKGRSGHGSSRHAERRAQPESSRILLICGAKQGSSRGEGPFGRRAKAREGEAESEANVGRGKA